LVVAAEALAAVCRWLQLALRDLVAPTAKSEYAPQARSAI